MPGIFQQSIDEALKEIELAVAAGLKSVLLFGIPDSKDSQASDAWGAEGIVQKAITAIKSRFPDLIVVADTCLCEYMDHGHCGIVVEGHVLNDPSLNILAKSAVAQAQAGADIIAPSDMMDGRVAAIRRALDEAGFDHIPIMAYSAKMALPFMVLSAKRQNPPPSLATVPPTRWMGANAREALREVELDIAEGADIVMVKPALAYLDIIKETRMITKLPIAAYNVSGEYSMVKAAAANGWIDEKKVVLETLTSMVRAGADLIITYHARDVAEWLRQ